MSSEASSPSRAPTRLAIALLGLTLLAVPGVARAATPDKPSHRPASHASGHFVRATQWRDRSIRVSGVAFDRKHPTRSIRVCIAVHNTCLRTIAAKHASPHFNKRHHVRGRHAFSVHVKPQRPGVALNLRGYAGGAKHLDRVKVSTPGSRVVNVAKRYVGRGRYTYGGASPQRGFDCSGYALYSYRRGHVAHLPHSAEAQRHVKHMHRISQRNARPGDLIFYLSGGSAYHVAIFAGHDMQYSAADESQGIRYQRIWSHNIVFGTNWH